MRLIWNLCIPCLLLTASCSSGEIVEMQATTSTLSVSTTVEVAADPTTTSVPDGFELTDAERSVVRIVVGGEFRYPSEGSFIEDGVGSGFVISESGLVLTAHHVVAGAATVKVKVGGSDSDVSAQVLGVSECDDLAVLQLPAGSYSPLAMADSTPAVGTPIYSAGFPPSSGNFEAATYTVTRGVVSSIVPNGESSWALVGEEIEHDAHIRGGSSGGPLFTEGGIAVGLNYAGDDELGTNYAVSIAPKRSLIDLLATGTDVTSMGVNGEALFGDENGVGLDGIWVYGVESGSPADAVGLRPGDVILAVEGLPVGDTGSMTTYCEVLRTRGNNGVSSLEVYRADTDEFLTGSFNGEPLSVASGLADQYAGVDIAQGDAYDDYVLIYDDSYAIEVEVPTAWSDVDGAYDEEFGGPSVWASTNIEDFWSSYGVPGVAIDTTRDSSQSMYSILTEIDYSGDCIDDGVLEYDDGIYTGYSRLWVDCPDGAAILVLAALPESQRFIVRLEAQIVTDADFEALDRILASFYVNE